MATTTSPITFADFEKLPASDRGFRMELRNGEPIEMPPPVHRHYVIQQHLLDLLKPAASKAGRVGTEMGFRVGPRNYRIADVAFVTRERWDAIPEDGYLEGAPELVIEILSPSNTASEIREKRRLCLESGCREFWVVDPQQREIEISTPDGRSLIHASGKEIALFFAPGEKLVPDSVFAS